MMTLEDFRSLKVGDVLELGSLFPGLGDHPTLLKACLKSDELEGMTFDALWQGVTLCKVVGRIKDGSLEWNRAV